ncbi:histidinol-phosphate transaminase [Ornithinibacillus gellani]|uniref:histidinol-phosphate transaminase n=1 Tax=Ornithinibacillus gellani TaxID=2293253 RepID=UPI000F491D50|nr:histidinol-phosphate transaminase [Ornithinibacillus gellani]TQS74411.1 histidinol-phosphate transaminase [Ornithinibacillus gellani]
MIGKEILQQLKPYKQGMQIDEVKKLYQLDRIVKLASNENAYGYSEEVKKMLSSGNFEMEFYPDGYAGELRHAVADRLQVEQDQLVFGSGSDEIVQMICRSMLYPSSNTVMAAGTFPQYRHNALIEGVEIREVPTISGKHDLNGMLHAIDKQTAVVWLCSPDNPTGTLIDRKSLIHFMDTCPKDTLVVLDEAYIEFVSTNYDVQAIELLNQYDNLIVLRTFSKAYGLAGFRVGYGIAKKEIADKINIARPPFNTTSLSQKAAMVALKDTSFIDKTVKLNKETKESFEQFLTKLGWKYFESHTNFLLVSTPISGMDTFQFLLERGFIVRPGELLGYPNTIRVTIGTADDMKQLQQLLTLLHEQIFEETTL